MLMNDGVATILRGHNTAAVGAMPVMEYEPLIETYYGEKTVGINRYWTAKSNDAQADLLIEIPLLPDVTVQDRCKLEPYLMPTGGTYKILQVQHVKDEDGQPCTDLTLELIDPLDDTLKEAGA